MLLQASYYFNSYNMWLIVNCYWTSSSLPEVFCKKDVLKDFVEFTGKHLSQGLLFKKETLAKLFSCEFCEIFKNTFLHRTPSMAASDWTSSEPLMYLTDYLPVSRGWWGWGGEVKFTGSELFPYWLFRTKAKYFRNIVPPFFWEIIVAETDSFKHVRKNVQNFLNIGKFQRKILQKGSFSASNFKNYPDKYQSTQ